MYNFKLVKKKDEIGYLFFFVEKNMKEILIHLHGSYIYNIYPNNPYDKNKNNFD